MRNVNPEDLEQLSKLIDGRGGIGDQLQEAFTRAGSLGVSSQLETLKPLGTWVTENGPDLRKRAAIARLESGDPEAGLRWAGFTTEDLERYQGDGLTPDALLLANSVAASADPNAEAFQRRADESLNVWFDRLKAHAIAQLPGLQPHEPTIQTIIGLLGDWTSAAGAATVVTIQATALTKILVGNALWQSPQLRAWKIRIGAVLRGSSNGTIQGWGSGIVRWTPPIRSLSAPGSWLPGRIAAWAGATGRVPFTNGTISQHTGSAYNSARRLPFMRVPILNGMSANGVINAIVGSDALAAMYGGTTHSGQAVSRAANASLLTVAKDMYADSRAVGASPGTALGRGAGAAAKVAGVLRGAGIVGGAGATYLAADELYHRGLPWQNGNFSTREKGAAYVANVAEVGFHASLTAATVSPNPVTIGATVVFGGVYVGAKVVQHWDPVKEWPEKAAGWVGDTAQNVASEAKDKAEDIASDAKDKAEEAFKDAGKALNPMNWG
ncbi:PE-PGRS family protein [Streptomyces sp. P1-3]|uniref:PE-PGRS family protein n=1 Tax=Streptomyces sp. P1-3 TaxID=3421658 RepID=UPI003D35BE0E